jgi:multiple sugar transport system permease protein
MSKRKRRKKILKTTGNILLAVVCIVICLGPLVWCLSTSFKPDNEILQYPPKLIASKVVLDQYQGIWNAGFWSYMRNSLFYAVVTILLALRWGSWQPTGSTGSGFAAAR